jgi:tRNA1(Val) A37 N6-methylase TrmN6
MSLQEPLQGDDETLDTFFHGRIRILQKKAGYRFSVDAPLLADFIQTRHDDEILELGTGCGIISLLLSTKPFRRVTALEIQDSLFDLARRNVRLNQLEDRITVLNQDLRTFEPPLKYDVVFSNPPYHALDRGHLSRVPEKTVAKHELKSDISDIMRKTAECLQADGRAYFIYPERRREDFVKAIHEAGLQLQRLRSIQPREGEKPNLFLSECGSSPAGCEEMPPLVLFDRAKEYSAEALRIFAGRPHD